MNVGIVSWWFNRGQATVGRHIRSALAELGHETFVLARPTPDRFLLSRFVDHRDVWDQPGVTPASRFKIPASEYERWVRDHAIEAVFFDQNYQFAEIARLRSAGVRTIGRFVWEQFGAEHVAGAKEALDVVYSLTRAEQTRYRDEFDLQTPYVSWGVHPELIAAAAPRHSDALYFFYPGGHLSDRKPTRSVVEAFRAVDDAGIRLVLKTQRPLKPFHVNADARRPLTRRGRARPEPEPRLRAAIADDRIIVDTADVSLAEYHRTFSACHVCLAPSRWEGLGLHFFEALAFGMPIITNDAPPMNELVIDGDTGLLVASRACGHTPSGLEASEPSVEGMRDAISTLADRAVM
ncbi:MAG: glycosyltransferase, partial [Phycisphaerae bacterium]|nr:glycosyltransferase [Phycisphaerae bacterium]